MELGGSDAFIVLKDADLDQTVKWAVWGQNEQQGQCCVAAKRLIVVEELADRFLDSSRRAGGTQARRSDGQGDDARTPVHRSGPGKTAAPDQTSRRQRRHRCVGANALTARALFHAADDPDEYQTRQSRLPGRILRAGALFFRVKNEDEAVALANALGFRLGDRSSPGMWRAANACEPH